MLNRYIWNIYLKADGEETAERFKSFLEHEITEESVKAYISTVRELWATYCASEDNLNHNMQVLQHLFDDALGDGIACECAAVLDLPDDAEYSIESVLNCLYKGINYDGSLNENDIFAEFTEEIEYYSTFLCIMFPDAFVPYYFRCNFNILTAIANEFDIELPPIPAKKDYKSRFFYYGEVCAALQDFRQKNNLSKYELFAFLYDFAPKYIGGIDSYIIKDLPEPKSAYFIGGDAKDAVNTTSPNVITAWQLNPDTRAGDMIVMYCRTPVSAVDSVWRSVSIGFNDPFFYYYRCAYISNCTKINQISQKQLQQDKVFKDLPIVRKNMQGINGIELLPSQYNHLMDIASADVARLQYDTIEGDADYVCEKDVEDKLVKRLIEKLGYSDDDYVQQLYIEIGNHNHAIIPDFVILPETSKGHYSAYFLIEAKLSISNNKFLEEVKTQARSYAKQLGAKYSVIASKEKVWITCREDDYSESVFVATWDELNDMDRFYEILKILGKGNNNAPIQKSAGAERR